MQVKTGRFFFGLFLITGVIGLMAYIIYHFFLPSFYPEIFPYILGFFLVANILFYIVFIRIFKSGSSLFIRRFLILFGVKLIIYLTAAVIVLLLFRVQAVYIVASAMALYLIYTGYEVLWLTSLVKRKEHK